MYVRHPADIFFSEFLYKKHCLWKQQGLHVAPAATSASLAEHIARLERSPGQRTVLTRFLAGASWCSCSADLHERRLWSAAELRRRARRNAATYLLIGVLERYNESMRLLERKLDDRGGRSGRQQQQQQQQQRAIGRVAASARSNALDACISQGDVPPSDLPTDAQRSAVLELLREDVDLYHELEQRLLRELPHT